MDRLARHHAAAELLVGWAHGPGAPGRATNRALAKVDTAAAIIIVEGISDQIAVETLAQRQGRDLDAESVVVLPVGGAHAVARYLRRFGPLGDQRHVAGLCDADAADVVRRGLSQAGFGSPNTLADMAGIGFHFCNEDLEHELIRAVGSERILAILDEQGELQSFRTFQKQPEWRGRPEMAQLRRFLAARSSRSLRYANLLVAAMDLDSVPEPLRAVLDDV